MILVNLFGAPGAGKSTGAAYIFSQLKMHGVNAELVTEYAKDKVWEESKAVFNNQAYIFGKQYFRISRCADKVDVVVTDSPLLLSLIYNNDPILGEEFNAVVRKVMNSYDCQNFYLVRVKDYNPAGRFQTESESDAIGDKIQALLEKENIDYFISTGDEAGYNIIIEEILNKLKET